MRDLSFDVAHYESWYETPAGRRADMLEKAVLGWLLQRLPHPTRALEVGCGTGHFSRWLSEQGQTVVGLDRSVAMLAQAQVLNTIPLVQGDAHHLPFADDTFDIAVLVTALEFLERPREALVESLRVARGGLILGVLNRWSVLGLQRRVTGLFRHTVYDEARFYSIWELKRLLRSVAGGRVHIVWRTTLFPRQWPWQQAPLPWGGFIGMTLVVEKG